MAALFMACCGALLLIAEPPTDHRHESYARSLWSVAVDVWNTAKIRSGYLALLICLLPIGSGAASNLWSAVAGDWHAGADTVALVNGVLGGMVSAVGCVAGGYLCDQVDANSPTQSLGHSGGQHTRHGGGGARAADVRRLHLLYAFIRASTTHRSARSCWKRSGGTVLRNYNIFASL
jgi:hypothetical protein